MAVSMQRAAGLSTRSTLVAKRPIRGVTPLIRCSAVPESKHETFVQKLAMPIAAAVTASALLVSLASPPEALAARSGGRAGASGFSARRAAPSRMAPGRSATVNNYSSSTIVAAPPVYSPFGFGGFGFGGVRIMPVMPIPFFGGFLQLMFLMLIVSVVFNVVKGALSGSSKSKNQDWDDL